MTTDFHDLKSLAAERYPAAFAAGEGDVFTLAVDGTAFEFFRALGDPEGNVCVRARVLSLDDIPRAGSFAKAAIAGNFFWGGTRGAMLSVGPDNALYLTERRDAGELAADGALEQCLADFLLSIGDWRERSALYA